MPAGRAPEQATLRTASQTVAIAPTYGSSAQARGLESTFSARPRRESLIRSTAASLPGPTTVLPCTIESYWRNTMRREATLGLEMIVRKAADGEGIIGGVFADAFMHTVSSAGTGARAGRS